MHGVVTNEAMDEMRLGNGKSVVSGDFLFDNVMVLDEDYIIDRSGPFSSIKFSNQVHDQIDSNMRNTIIVCLLGQTIGFRTLQSRLNAM
ncbi:hypothetical protein V6N13_053861 [Hibiscus sabdariffa]